MNKLRKSLLGAAAVIVAAASLVSCNSNDPKGVPTEYMVDIVTLTGVSNSGFVATFRQIDDSPLVTLTFAGNEQKVDTNIVKVGQRFLLQYWPESGVAFRSGPAVAYGYRPILNATITEGTSQSTSAWQSDDQDIIQLWRTDTFINVHAYAPYSTTPKKYALILDKETADNEVPTAYLQFLSDNPYESAALAFYASFDIAPVWNKESVRGLTVKVATVGGQKTYHFYKEGNEDIRPNE